MIVITPSDVRYDAMAPEDMIVVWANHGLLAIGTSLKLASKVSVAVEENAEVLFHAERAWRPNVLQYDHLSVPEGAPLP